MSYTGETSDDSDVETQGATMMAPEISGGRLDRTNIGGQFGQYISTQINKTYNPVGGSGKPQTTGQFEVSYRITVLEKDPISLSSRIFKGLYHSDVTGDRPAAIKITPALEKNYREAKIYFSVPHHKNIVERFATDTFNFRGQPSIFIAMECCDCNLYEHVTSEERDGIPFDEEKYSWIAYQILVALEHLHSHGVVHGDFKPANVLLILNGNIVKVTDFGLSRAVTDGKTSTQLTSPQGGTTGWQAPEIPNGSARISFKSDVFPCGLTLFFVWSHGKHPYGSRIFSLNHYIVEGTNRDLSGLLVSYAAEAKILLEKTLQRNPAERPSVSQLLQWPIFTHLGPRPLRVGDSALAGIFDGTLEPDPRQQQIYTRDDKRILGVTAAQLQDALRSFIQKNPQQLALMTSYSQSSLISYGPSMPAIQLAQEFKQLEPTSIYSPNAPAHVPPPSAIENPWDETTLVKRGQSTSVLDREPAVSLEVPLESMLGSKPAAGPASPLKSSIRSSSGSQFKFGGSPTFARYGSDKQSNLGWNILKPDAASTVESTNTAAEPSSDSWVFGGGVARNQETFGSLALASLRSDVDNLGFGKDASFQFRIAGQARSQPQGDGDHEQVSTDYRSGVKFRE